MTQTTILKTMTHCCILKISKQVTPLMSLLLETPPVQPNIVKTHRTLYPMLAESPEFANTANMSGCIPGKFGGNDAQEIHSITPWLM